MIYIAILDDENKIRMEMENLLSNIQKTLDVNLKISLFEKAQNLMSEMEEQVYDIVFLDIELGDDNGIKIAEILKKKYPMVVIAFITGHYQYVYKVFDVRPCGFIRKPLQRDDVEHTLNIALRECDAEAMLKYFNKGRFYKIFLNDIYYITSEKRKIYIRKMGETVDFYIKIKEIEETLQAQSCNFLRISQSVIINVKYLKEMSYKEVVIETDSKEVTFNISQKYQVQVRRWCLENWK